jgi:hypothetical protein
LISNSVSHAAIRISLAKVVINLYLAGTKEILGAHDVR